MSPKAQSKCSLFIKVKQNTWQDTNFQEGTVYNAQIQRMTKNHTRARYVFDNEASTLSYAYKTKVRRLKSLNKTEPTQIATISSRTFSLKWWSPKRYLIFLSWILMTWWHTKEQKGITMNIPKWCRSRSASRLCFACLKMDGFKTTHLLNSCLLTWLWTVDMSTFCSTTVICSNADNFSNKNYKLYFATSCIQKDPSQKKTLSR